MNSGPVGTVFGADKYSMNNLRANLVVGKTTQADVRRIFGEPQRTDSYLDNPNGRWEYNNKMSQSVFGTLLNYVPSMGNADSQARNMVAGHEPSYGVSISFQKGVVQSFMPISPNGK
ncbi:hypothetical protein WS90_24680 [Burkholderia cepacia]|uniref:Uncharacterized protein n=2 Tax=Burkholderia cepacia TaxID=292 RepID=A0A118KEX2_BURCE|nr:hypothetical protein WS90_24680 [Burkholderia cepacia]